MLVHIQPKQKRNTSNIIKTVFPMHIAIYYKTYQIKIVQWCHLFWFHNSMFQRFLFFLHRGKSDIIYTNRKVQEANARCPYTVNKVLPVVKEFDMLISLHSDLLLRYQESDRWQALHLSAVTEAPKYWQSATFQETIDVHSQPQLQTPLRQSL